MHVYLRLVFLASILLVIFSSNVVLADVYYPEWVYLYDGGGYDTLYFYGISGDFYDNLVYATVELNNTSNGNLDFGVVAYYTNGSLAWDYSLDVRSRDYVKGCYPDPMSDYLIVAGYSPVTLTTWDGILLVINRSNPNDWSGIYFDTGKNEFFHGVTVGGDGSVYAVGEYYNGSWYYGLIVRYDNYSLSDGTWTAYTTQSYNVTFYDAAIGPDGYLYITGHLVYRYVDSSNNVYYVPIYQLVYKLNPTTLEIVNTTYIPLYTSQNYILIVNAMKVDIANCGNGICIAGFFYDEAINATNPTLGLMIIKFDTNFNIVWEHRIATTYHELAHGIASDIAGNITVVGETNNNYGSNLSTNYYHILDIVLDENGNLKQAFLAGGDYGENGLDSTVDINGNTYIVGAQYSTTLTFYNITSNITIQSKPIKITPLGLETRETIIYPSIKIESPPTPYSSTAKTSNNIIGLKPSNTQPYTKPITLNKTSTPSINPSPNRANPPLIVKPLQTGDNDVAVIASLGYYIEPNSIPPIPIPEPHLLTIILVPTIIAAYYYLRKR